MFCFELLIAFPEVTVTCKLLSSYMWLAGLVLLNPKPASYFLTL